MPRPGFNQDSGRFFDDMARLATGAVGAMSGFRQHLRQEIKTHLDRFLIELDLGPRSDFEVVEAMVKQARQDNESLKKRMAALEAQLSGKGTAKPAATKVKAAPAKKSVSKSARKPVKKAK